MTTTRRLSGMPQGSNHQQTSLMLETYEAFKRKHLSQNKEIIHKNSELHKSGPALKPSIPECERTNPSRFARRANADLQRQISLMRAERLSLKGSQFQLECENAALRDKLERAEERERQLIDDRRIQHRGGMDADQVEAMRHALANAVAALQAFGLMLPSGSPLSSPMSSPNYLRDTPSPTRTSSNPDPESSPSSQPLPSDNNVSLSRRRSLAARAGRPSISSKPDLLHMHLDPTPALEPEPPHPASALPTPPAAEPAPSASPIATSRFKKSPPKAPSAASHALLASTSSEATITDSSSSSSTARSRPSRRVSGLLRPPPHSSFQEADERPEPSLIEEPEEENAGALAHADDGSEYRPSTTAAAAKGKGKARARSSRAGGTAEPSSEPEPVADMPVKEQQQAGIVQEAEPEPEVEAEVQHPRRRRTALKEIQPLVAGSLKGKEQASAAPLSRWRNRALSSSSETEGEGEEDEIEAPPRASGSALLKAKKDALRTQRSARGASPVEAEVEKEQEQDQEMLPDQTKVRVRRGREIEESEARGEEAGGSQGWQPSEETGGRRARKSVNYALPKLNTCAFPCPVLPPFASQTLTQSYGATCSKMRRPEDYVPVIKHVSSTAQKPRKSTKAPAPSSSSSSSSTAPPAPSAPPSLSSFTSSSRPSTLLAGKKPSSSTSNAPQQQLAPPADDDDSSSGEDSWNEQQFLRRASSQPNANPPRSSLAPAPTPVSRANQEADERRKQRQAQKEQLSRAGGGGGSLAARRHSVAV
ncbi:SPOSA6832_01264 [Sporobolomyces salmonicolor]|uniref:SPOSA6832_01264-mRNA-1:cds n=1 Tax=Sporidiobolus salmonicolor TaxID=5005 RepID=A0A0D6EI76_SPOSA|nr:SPOSA6832_01264 [Sporobolomyces salmonicolor]